MSFKAIFTNSHMGTFLEDGGFSSVEEAKRVIDSQRYMMFDEVSIINDDTKEEVFHWRRSSINPTIDTFNTAPNTCISNVPVKDYWDNPFLNEDGDYKDAISKVKKAEKEAKKIKYKCSHIRNGMWAFSKDREEEATTCPICGETFYPDRVDEDYIKTAVNHIKNICNTIKMFGGFAECEGFDAEEIADIMVSMDDLYEMYEGTLRKFDRSMSRPRSIK